MPYWLRIIAILRHFEKTEGVVWVPVPKIKKEWGIVSYVLYPAIKEVAKRRIVLKKPDPQYRSRCLLRLHPSVPEDFVELIRLAEEFNKNPKKRILV